VTSVGLSAFGVIEVAGALAVSSATQCLTDQFSVTNPNGAAPPVICGTNTGEHMVTIHQVLLNPHSIFVVISDFSMSLPVICALKRIFSSVKWQCKIIKLTIFLLPTSLKNRAISVTRGYQSLDNG